MLQDEASDERAADPMVDEAEEKDEEDVEENGYKPEGVEDAEGAVPEDEEKEKKLLPLRAC